MNEQNQHLRAAIEDAKKLIPLLPLKPHKPWISRNTLQLIANVRDSVGLSAEEVKSTRNRIKAAPRRDKKLFVKTQLSKDYEIPLSNEQPSVSFAKISRRGHQA